MPNELLTASEKIMKKLDAWGDLFIANIPNIVIALVVVVLSYFISRGVYKLMLKLTYNRIKQTSIALLISRFSAAIIVLVGLFLALGALNLGETLTALLSAAGISGLVIGLALQGTLSNMFSGIVLAFRKNIKIGNWIESNGFAGEVMDINLNYFVLKEADNNHVVIPNKSIVENPFKNYSLTTQMRITISCGVGYESDLDEVQRIVTEVIEARFDQEKIGKKMEFYYTDFGDSSINFITRFWIDAENGLEKLRAKSKAIIEIKKAFKQYDINIPFPIRTLQFDNKLSVKQVQPENIGMN